MSELNHSNGLDVANGTILMALLDHFIADSVMRPHDVRVLLKRALDDLRPRDSIVSVREAIAIIENEMLPRFEKSIKKN